MSSLPLSACFALSASPFFLEQGDLSGELFPLAFELGGFLLVGKGGVLDAVECVQPFLNLRGLELALLSSVSFSA